MHPTELPIKIGDKEYIFSPLNLIDSESLITSCQFDGYTRVKAYGLPQAELDNALRICMRNEPTEADLTKYYSSTSGVVEIFYLSLKKKQPNITAAEVKEVMAIASQSKDTVDTLTEFIGNVTNPKADGAEGDQKN